MLSILIYPINLDISSIADDIYSVRVLFLITFILSFAVGQDIHFQSENSTDSITADSAGISGVSEITVPTNITELNSSHSDFAPFVTADGREIYYASSRDNSIGGEDIYYSHWERGRWTVPKNIGRPVNSRYNEAAVCPSPDGSELFITICGGPDSYGGCDIYVCTRKGDGWNEPKNMGKKVNSTWWDGHPCLSPTGDTLYFASDRFGGFGGLDIYYTVRTSKGWSKPKNIGYPVNNARDQTSPFLHIDGRTMYFSSAGHGGLGGLDVMMARIDTITLKWDEPLNIGPPVNTSGNDYFFSVPGSGEFIYFASDRPAGYGGFDLYSYPLDEWQRPQVVATLIGNVVDAETNEPLAAQVKIERLSDGKLIRELQTDSRNGQFFIVLSAGETYGISVSAPDYAFASENYKVKTQEGYNELSHTFKLRKIAVGSIVELVNLFFDFGKWELRPESESELKRVAELMRKYPDMRIEVQGFADSVGTAEFNLKLSTLRAKAVRNWLKWNGIPTDRVAYRGFGEEKQGATEEDLQQSRRVQFKILGLGEDSSKTITPELPAPVPKSDGEIPSPDSVTGEIDSMDLPERGEIKLDPIDTISAIEEYRIMLEHADLDSLADSLFMKFIVLKKGYHFGELESNPVAVKTTALGYPQRARDRGIQGIALVEFAIDTTGIVIPGSAEVIRAIPKGIFEGVAIEAIYHWQFTPAVMDGEKLETRWLQPLIFKTE